MALDPLQRTELLKRKQELLQQKRDILVEQQKRQTAIAEAPEQVTDLPRPLTRTQAEAVEVLEAPKEETGFFERLGASRDIKEQEAAQAFKQMSVERKERLADPEGFEETLTGDIEKSKALAEEGVATIGEGYKALFSPIDTTGDLPQDISNELQKRFGGVVDILQGGVQTTVSPFPALAPDFVEKPAEKIFGFLGALGGEGAKKAIEITGGDPESEVGKSTIEAAALLSQLLGGKAIAKTTGKVVETAKPFIAEKVVRPLEAKVTKDIKFAEQLVEPKLTPKQQAAEIQTGQFEVINGKRTRVTPAREAEMSQVINKIPEVSSKKTLAENAKAIELYQDNVVLPRVRQDIKTKGGIFTQKELQARLNTIKQQMAESVELINFERAGNIMINKFNEFMKGKPNRADALWEARIKLDQWAKEQGAKFKTGKPGESGAVNARTAALTIIRDNINDFVANKSKDVAFKAEMKEMSNLYKAREALAPKVAAEAPTRLGRAIQKVHESLGRKGEIAAGTIGTITAIMAPGIIATALKVGVPLYAIGKGGQWILTKPGKELVVNLLKNHEILQKAVPQALPTVIEETQE